MSVTFTPEEDEILRYQLVIAREKRWEVIGSYLNKPAQACRARWTELLKEERKNKKRGHWTEEEDQLLIDIVSKQPTPINWRYVSSHFKGTYLCTQPCTTV